MAATAIRVGLCARDRLAHLKSSPEETCDGPLQKLMALMSEGYDEGRHADAFRAGLLNARPDVRRGRLTGRAEVKDRLGL